MITRWLANDGGWRSLTANERQPWGDGTNLRCLGSHQVNQWWHNELGLIAAPCFELTDMSGGAGGTAVGKTKTLFTVFSIIDRMHRPQ